MLVFLTTSCDFQQNAEITIEPERESSIVLSTFSDSIRYIPLQAPDSVIVGEITDVFFKNGRYYCADVSTDVIHVFDQNGNYDFQINAYGSGPGEYESLTDVFIDDYIYVLSRSQKKIIRFGLDGMARDQLKLPVYVEAFRPIKAGVYLTYSSTGGHLTENGRQAGIGLLESKATGVDYNVVSSFGGDYAPFGSMQRQYFSQSENGFLLLNPTDIVYGYDGGDISERYAFDFGNIAMPVAYQQLANNPGNHERLRNTEFVIHKDYLLETEDFVLTRFLQGDSPIMNYLMYNKETGKARYAGEIKNDLQGLFPYEFPMFKKSEYEAISVISPEVLEAYQQEIDKQKMELTEYLGEEKMAEVDDFYHRSMKNGNPVLVITQLKMTDEN